MNNKVRLKTKKIYSHNDKGVTMISLVIVIIILIIIGGISISSGKVSVRRAKLEELRTNMLLIESKAKTMLEEVTFLIGPYETTDATYSTRKNNSRGEIYVKKYKMYKDSANDNKYKLTDDTYKIIGLEDLSNKNKYGEFYIIFNEENYEVEVYNTKGFEGKYSLKDIENL